jgi:hypothetical protein
VTAHQRLVVAPFFLVSPEARDPLLALPFKLGDDLGESLVLGRKEEGLGQIDPSKQMDKQLEEEDRYGLRAKGLLPPVPKTPS